MSDEIKFCYKCGANVPEGSSFCTECGASLNGGNTNRTEYTAVPNNGSNNMGAIPILLLIYGIVAIIGAIFLIIIGISFNMIIETLKEFVESGALSEDDYEEVMKLISQIGTDTIMLYCTAQGAILIISGVLALIAGHFANKQMNYMTTIVCCGVSAVITFFIIPFDLFFGILLPVIGLIVTYAIYKRKDNFIS